MTPLPSTLSEACEYAQKNGRIVAWARYGQHIILACRNHPDHRYSTKNISPIGCRTIFGSFSAQDDCECGTSDLFVVVPDDWQDKIVPLEILHCRCCGSTIGEEGPSRATHCHDCFEAMCFYPKEGEDCKAGRYRVRPPIAWGDEHCEECESDPITLEKINEHFARSAEMGMLTGFFTFWPEEWLLRCDLEPGGPYECGCSVEEQGTKLSNQPHCIYHCSSGYHCGPKEMTTKP